MKIIITGGAGFLGFHLVAQAIARGDEIMVIDNYATAQREKLTPQENLKIVEGTIADKAFVHDIFVDFKPDFVIHAAAAYKNPDNWREDIHTNVLGTAHVVQASQHIKVRRFVYLQTALCYGKSLEKPITLSHPLQPFTSYSITKTAGENYVKLSGLSYVSLRLANIYGSMHFSGPIPTFYKRLKENKKCFVVDTRRDFLEIGDFLSLVKLVLNNDSVVGCFNVSSGVDNSIKDIYELIVKNMGLPVSDNVEVRAPDEDDVDTLLLDPSETEKAFHWKAKIGLDEGIKSLIQWYEQYGVDEAYTHLKIGKKT